MEPLEYCCTSIFVNPEINFPHFLLDDGACLDGTAAHGAPLLMLLSFALQFWYSADTKEDMCSSIFNNLEQYKVFGNNVWLPEKFQDVFECERFFSKY
jgi:hypothetical protein